MLRLFSLGVLTLLLANLSYVPTVSAQDEEGLSQQEIAEMFQDVQAHIQAEEWADAAKLCKEIVEANDSVGPAWFYLGYSLHMDKKLDEALKAHKKAAEFDQFAPVATYNIACAYSLQKKTDEAIKALKKAITLGFNDADQIDGDSDMDNIRKDERFVKIMAKLKGEDSDDADDKGEMKKDKKEDAGKGESADKKVERDVEAGSELVNEGRQLMGENDFAAAAKSFAKATKADPENALAWHLYGYCLHASGELDKAIEIHKKATHYDQYAGISLYNLGCAYSLKKDADKAFEALNKAVEYGFVRDTAFDDDTDLDNIRKDERFEKLMARVNAKRNSSDDDGDDDDDDGDDEEEDDDDDNDN